MIKQNPYALLLLTTTLLLSLFACQPATGEPIAVRPTITPPSTLRPTITPPSTLRPTITPPSTPIPLNSEPSVTVTPPYPTPTPYATATTILETTAVSITTTTNVPPHTPPPIKPEIVEMDTWVSNSPDGQWAAYGYWLGVRDTAQDKLIGYNMLLNIVNAETNTVWPVINEEQGVGLGYRKPQIYHWSTNGRFAYVNHGSVTDGGCLPYDLSNSGLLFQVDLTTGEVINLMDRAVASLALSPDETTIAFTTHDSQPKLYLHNIVNNNHQAEITFPQAIDYAGMITWSPNNQQILLVNNNNPGHCQDGALNLWLVDLSTSTTTLLLENDTLHRYPISWNPDSKTAVLRDLNEQTWHLTITNGALTPIEQQEENG